MKHEALARHLQLPAGLHKASGAVLTLAECRRDPSAVLTPAQLSVAQKIALVKARWLAGEWSDIVYGTEGTIDRDKAIRELEAQSDIGRHLMEIELRAIEMTHEEAAQQGNP